MYNIYTYIIIIHRCIICTCIHIKIGNKDMNKLKNDLIINTYYRHLHIII